MIPILYPKTETEWTSNGLGRLSDAISCVVTEERNGIFELEMKYPMTGIHFSDIECDCYIKAICSAKKVPQLFRVYSVTKPINGQCTVLAEHVSYQLLHIPVMPFTATGLSATLQALKTNAVGDCPFTFYTDISSQKRFTISYPKAMRGILQGDQWSILQNFSGEYEWDNFTVRLLTQRGVDHGVVLRYGKNIIDLKQEENIQQTYTGIVPYWLGMEGEKQVLVTLPENVLYSANKDNFPYTRVLPVDFSEQIENKPTVTELRTAGNNYITRNDIGIPSVSISLNFVDLSQTEEYKDLSPESLNLCDLITVQFSELGVSKKAKITRTTYDVLTERYTNLYIGESYHSLASLISNQSADTKTVAETATNNLVHALNEATKVLNGDITGSMMKTLVDADGNPQGIIIMDTNNESTAVNCIRINSNGIGFSNNGVNGPYTSAWLIDNTLDMSKINVIHIDASAIDAGTISASRISGGTLKGITAEFGTSTIQGYPAIRIFSDGTFQMYQGSSALMYDTRIYGLDYAYTQDGKTTDVIADASWWISNENLDSNTPFKTMFYANKYVGNYSGRNRFKLRAEQNGGILSLYSYKSSATGETTEVFKFDAYNESLRILARATGYNVAVISRDSTYGGRISLYDENGKLAVWLDRSGLQFIQNNVIVKEYGPSGIYP